MRLLDWLLCKLGRCRQCRTHENEIGIGGRCINCGRLHGWISHIELRAILEGRRGPVSPPCDLYIVADPIAKLPPAYVVRGPKGWQ